MSTSRSPASVCNITSATLGAIDHSRAVFTMWLLAAMIQMSNATLSIVTGSCQTESGSKRRCSHNAATNSGESTA